MLGGLPTVNLTFSSLPASSSASTSCSYKRLWRTFDLLVALSLEAGVLSVGCNAICNCACHLGFLSSPPLIVFIISRLTFKTLVLDFNLKCRCTSLVSPGMYVFDNAFILLGDTVKNDLWCCRPVFNGFRSVRRDAASLVDLSTNFYQLSPHHY